MEQKPSLKARFQNDPASVLNERGMNITVFIDKEGKTLKLCESFKGLDHETVKGAANFIYNQAMLPPGSQNFCGIIGLTDIAFVAEAITEVVLGANEAAVVNSTVLWNVEWVWNAVDVSDSSGSGDDTPKGPKGGSGSGGGSIGGGDNGGGEPGSDPEGGGDGGGGFTGDNDGAGFTGGGGGEPGSDPEGGGDGSGGYTGNDGEGGYSGWSGGGSSGGDNGGGSSGGDDGGDGGYSGSDGYSGWSGGNGGDDGGSDDGGGGYSGDGGYSGWSNGQGSVDPDYTSGSGTQSYGSGGPSREVRGTGTPTRGSGSNNPSYGTGGPSREVRGTGTPTRGSGSNNPSYGTGGPSREVRGTGTPTRGSGSNNPSYGTGGPSREVRGTGTPTRGSGSNNPSYGTGDPGREVRGTGTPIEGSGRPVEGTGTPIHGTGEPIQGTGRPIEGTGTPIHGTGEPIQGTGRPIEGSGTPIHGTGEPIQGTGKPIRGSGSDIVKGAGIEDIRGSGIDVTVGSGNLDPGKPVTTPSERPLPQWPSEGNNGEIKAPGNNTSTHKPKGGCLTAVISMILVIIAAIGYMVWCNAEFDNTDDIQLIVPNVIDVGITETREIPIKVSPSDSRIEVEISSGKENITLNGRNVTGIREGSAVVTVSASYNRFTRLGAMVMGRNPRHSDVVVMVNPGYTIRYADNPVTLTIGDKYVIDPAKITLYPSAIVEKDQYSFAAQGSSVNVSRDTIKAVEAGESQIIINVTIDGTVYNGIFTVNVESNGEENAETPDEPIKTHYHKWSFVRKSEPDCTTPGYEYYKCTCGQTMKKRYADPLGHDLYETKDFTDDGDMIIHHYCYRCRKQID